MTVVPPEVRPLAKRPAFPVLAYARAAGVLAIVSLVAGGFGEAYAPGRLISSADAAATVQNLRSLDFIFRLGFAGYLVEAICDVALALMFYALLKPVDRYIALMAAFFGLLGTASFAGAELFYYAPTLVLRDAAYLKAFTSDQLNVLALLSLKLYVLGAAIFSAFYGTAWVLRGYLMFRSEYLPKLLGVLMALAGFAFVTQNFAVVLAPKHPSGWLMLLMLPGFVVMAVWLLVKGVDVAKWEEAQQTELSS
jgi:hypothetical protein